MEISPKWAATLVILTLEALVFAFIALGGAGFVEGGWPSQAGRAGALTASAVAMLLGGFITMMARHVD